MPPLFPTHKLLFCRAHSFLREPFLPPRRRIPSYDNFTLSPLPQPIKEIPVNGTTIRLGAILFLTLATWSSARSQDLTSDAARDMLNKLGSDTAASDFTLTQDQARDLKALSPALLAPLAIQTTAPCLPNPGDKRVQNHQFVTCQGIFPNGVSTQNPGVYLKVGRTFHWHIVEMAGIVDPTEDHSQRIVAYTWEYDFSDLPAEVQTVLKQGSRHEGRSLFQLDGGTWKWLRYQ